MLGWDIICCRESIIVDLCVIKNFIVIVVDLKLFFIYCFRIYVSKLFISVFLELMKIKEFGGC